MPSKIEWTDTTWNPVTGCSKVSQGCKHCYAETIAKRFWGERSFTDVQMHPERLDEPLRWRKPRRVFVNSMSDLFHPDVPFEFIDKVFAVMNSGGAHHVYQILTKRQKRMLEYVSRVNNSESHGWYHAAGGGGFMFGRWPLPNVWLGVSVEDQPAADERIPLLLQTPAAVRFVSCEPLLGPVNLEPYLQYPPFHENYKLTFGENEFRGLDWVICGGESGPGARPMHPDWARSLRDQCQAAGVPFFFKQWGEFRWDGKMPITGKIGKKAAGRMLDGREWSEFPNAIR